MGYGTEIFYFTCTHYPNRLDKPTVDIRLMSTVHKWIFIPETVYISDTGNRCYLSRSLKFGSL